MISHMLPFRKMSGLGNDFAVFDGRAAPIALSVNATRRLSDRKGRVGCDQVIVIEPSARADVFMRILNADGSEVGACGNATRCVGALIAGQLGRPSVVIETAAGLLASEVHADGMVTVDMGVPRFGWQEIPLAWPVPDTNILDYTVVTPGGVLSAPSVANIGNPHCLFWVDDLDVHDLAAIGPRIEKDHLFPERVNVSLARVASRDRIELRVWERGAGLTQACGSAACAVAAAAARRGLTGREVDVVLPGGVLRMKWREPDDHILMTGPWRSDYESVFDAGEAAPVA
jgi:diaminopimelate epimerase